MLAVAFFIRETTFMTEGKSLTENADKTEMDVILDDVSFSYVHMETEVVSALSDVSLSLARGSYTALLGRNGSGKSTMAKLIDVLELPQEGSVLVIGNNTNDESVFWEIRTSCGMVFQNPDNQIVGTTVEEDVAFGPENLGVPTAEIRSRVDDALRYVGLTELSLRQPSQLSGGQKQKLAIAGILAMSPQILLLDESTSMLDPISRDDFLALVDKLIRDKHMTVLHITHDMSEACLADRIVVLDHGKVALSGTPGEVFSQVEAVRALGLDVPVFADLAFTVSERLGVEPDRKILFSRELALNGIREMLRRPPVTYMPAASESGTAESGKAESPVSDKDKPEARTVLQVSHLSHFYEKGGAPALDDVSFSVKEGEIFAIIGHSGSGKTTLITHLNGLMRPESGDVFVYPKDGTEPLNVRKNADVRSIRRLVGLLFQYPEYQLFEETVRKDIAFGPKKMGYKDSQIEEKVQSAIRLLGLDDSILERSPFELSGGQKRRVAFAGVIAMDPDILVLDEPAAGLDPTRLKAMGKTVIIVSHNMDEAARYADRILVLKHGKASEPMTPGELFTDEDRLKDLGITAPEIVTCLRELKKEIPDIRLEYFRATDAADEIIRAFNTCNQPPVGDGYTAAAADNTSGGDAV